MTRTPARAGVQPNKEPEGQFGGSFLCLKHIVDIPQRRSI